MPGGGNLVRVERYKKKARTPKSAHARYYYTRSLVLENPWRGGMPRARCQSAPRVMDSHSRSASPREQPRPQHRPPSPPSPPSPAAFDNRAYSHDDADQNHNESFSSGTPQHNGHSKEPNGDSKTLEAVNLELINLTPKNGSKRKDVEVDMNATNPYDEYFVPVNEHRKYMRGEKLYVTADKRGEKGGCKRPLCWTLLGLVVAAVVALIVLAATGVLFTNSPTTVEQYNSSISTARALGGIGSPPVGHDHSHRSHDHSPGHGYAGHDIADTPDTQSDEGDSSMESDETSDMSMYVPRTVEGEVTIDNEEFTHEMQDPESSDYFEFSATFTDALMKALFDRNTLEREDNDIKIEVISIKKGSLVVTYRIQWTPKSNAVSGKDFLTASSLQRKLNDYLSKNDRMISTYHVAEDKVKSRPVLDLCKISNNDCDQSCEFDDTILDFTCVCPPGQMLDIINPKKCTTLFPNSEKTEPQFDEATKSKEFRGLEMDTTPITTKPTSEEKMPNKGFESTNEYEMNFSHFDNPIEKTSHNGHAPEPSPEPTAEPESEPEPEPQAEPKPKSSNPQAAPEPTSSEEPQATPEPNSSEEPQAAPEPIPSEEPQATPEPTISGEPQAELEPIPSEEPQATAEPIPSEEPKATSELILSEEPRAKPELHLSEEPSATPEPIPSEESIATPEPIPSEEPSTTPEPIPSKESSATPEPTPSEETSAMPEPIPSEEPTAEPTQTNIEQELKLLQAKLSEIPAEEPETTPEPEPSSEPEPTPEPRSEPEPTAEPNPSDLKQDNNMDISTESRSHKTESSTKLTKSDQFEESDGSHETESSLLNVNPNDYKNEFMSANNEDESPLETTPITNDNSKSDNVKHTSDTKADTETTTESDWLDNTKSITDIHKPEQISQSRSLFSDANEITAETTTAKSKNNEDITFNNIINVNEQPNVIHMTTTEKEKVDTTIASVNYTSIINRVSSVAAAPIVAINQLNKQPEVKTKKIYDEEENTDTITKTTSSESKKYGLVIPTTSEPESATEYFISKQLKDFDNGKELMNDFETKTEAPTTTKSVTTVKIPHDDSIDITFDDIKAPFYNRSSKSIYSMNSSNHEVTELNTEPTVATTESEWLSENATEVPYDKDMNSMEKQETTESSMAKIDELISKGDFEPDYFNMGTASSKMADTDVPMYGMSQDYDGDPRVKRVNKETNTTPIMLQELVTKSIAKETTTETSPKDNIETTTVNDYIYKSAGKNNDESSAPSINITETSNMHTQPAPVWEPSDSYTDLTAKQFPEVTNQDLAKPPTKNTTAVEMEEEADAISSQNTTQTRNLNVNVYEVPSSNDNNSFTSTVTNSHSAEHEDHESDMNPFLPEAENNKNLVEKLLKGHDLEPINLNETQNENIDDHNVNTSDAHVSSNTDTITVVTESNERTTKPIEQKTQSIPNNSNAQQVTEKTLVDDKESTKTVDKLMSDDISFSTHQTEAPEPTSSSVSSFLLDTEDLDGNKDVTLRKLENSNTNIVTETISHPGDDYLSVIPVALKSSDKEAFKNYESETIQKFNDISSDSTKNSDRTQKVTLSKFNTKFNKA